MPNPIDISKLISPLKIIAEKYDITKDGFLEKNENIDEVSLFCQECGIEEYKFQNLEDTSIWNIAKDNEITGAHIEPAVSTRVNKTKIELPIIKNEKEIAKQEIITKLYQKWSSKFPNSPLKEDFYNKLYDVIKTLNCTVSDKEFKPDVYTSKEEQTMDEVIAIFAGESQLNPKAQNGPYKGLFQLASLGLTECKLWAQKHKNVAGTNNIKFTQTINSFKNLDGNIQLDYLVAYIGKSKEYSKIKPSETITPSQLWAMIKSPRKGKNSTITQSKNDTIQKIISRYSTPNINS